ncbi:MAG: hypothetical protein NTU52_00865 [Actinobacteria bacterium]|nr:hypothetical protein [Actinomycetota bacterium]
MSISDKTTPRQRRAGIGIHLVTASGAIAGLLALQSVIDGSTRAALMWLIVCQILDAIDGPVARRLNVTIHAPMIDGHILDLVIDYVSCVVVPIALMIKLEVLPPHTQIWIAALMIFTSALWFARTDQETPDVWFNGFPAGWNIVVPTFIILGTDQQIAGLIVVALGLSQSVLDTFCPLSRSDLFGRNCGVANLVQPTHHFWSIY